MSRCGQALDVLTALIKSDSYVSPTSWPQALCSDAPPPCLRTPEVGPSPQANTEHVFLPSRHAEEGNHWGSDEENYGSAAVPADFVQREDFQ